MKLCSARFVEKDNDEVVGGVERPAQKTGGDGMSGAWRVRHAMALLNYFCFFFVRGLNFNADESEHLLNILYVSAIRSEFQIFFQRLSGSRRRGQHSLGIACA